MAKAPRITHPRRGEVYLVNFDPTVGAEIRKTRSALILQNDIANRHSPITIVAAITSQFAAPLYPTEVLVTAGEAGLPRDSVVLCNQIRSIDKRRLTKRMGLVTSDKMRRVERGLLLSVGILKV